MLAAVLCLGALRTACEHPFPEWLLLRTPFLARVEGTVVSYPAIGDSAISFTFAPDGLPGRFTVRWFHDGARFSAIHFGDRLAIVGRAAVPTPFEGFDYPDYLARQGVFATLRVEEDGVEVLERGKNSPFVWGDRLRQSILARLHGTMPLAEGVMARGLLFGDRAALADDLEAAFAKTGLMHLLAVSGLHLGVFLAGVWWILRRAGVRPRWAYPAVGLLVLTVLWVVGPRVSLVRASLLFGFLGLGSVLADLGWVRRRTISSLDGLGAAAVAILAMRPGALHDAGFQLTFAATASILILFSEPISWGRQLAPLAERLGVGALRTLISGLFHLAAVSLAAQAGAGPIIAWHFGTLHPFAMVANLAAVPLAGGSLWCGIAAIVLSPTAILGIAVQPLVLLLSAMKGWILCVSRIPLSQLPVPKWMAVWLGGLVLFSLAAAYLESESSWTRYSMSMASGSPDGRSGGRRRTKAQTASVSPARSLRRPGSSRSRPATKRRPTDCRRLRVGRRASRASSFAGSRTERPATRRRSRPSPALRRISTSARPAPTTWPSWIKSTSSAQKATNKRTGMSDGRWYRTAGGAAMRLDVAD